MEVSTRQLRIAESARNYPDRSFVSLNHYIDLPWMREAFQRTRKSGATGVDGETAAQFAENLDENLTDLLNQFKSGSYEAPPVKRDWVPKPGTDEQRPIGIPTFGRKVLERSLTMVLEQIYEQDFLDCSFGFRPNRSATDALESIREAITRGCYWVIDADVRKYFDTLVHQHLRTFLDRRVRDGVIRRTINKLLKAGVWDKGKTTHSDTGAPQGGVISPMLSNIYLHEVLDRWFMEMARPRLTGRAYLIRFADDFVILCEDKRDAERLMNVLPKRFEKFGLTIHPDKTCLVDFRPPGLLPAGQKSATFDFLGFTHHWGRSRWGKTIVKRRTAKDRQQRALKGISDYCRRHRHDKVQEQYTKLCQKLNGHYSYYGLTGNNHQPARVHHQASRVWFKWLNRRNRNRSMNWEQFSRRILGNFPLPRPRIIHSIDRLRLRPFAGILC